MYGAIIVGYYAYKCYHYKDLDEEGWILSLNEKFNNCLLTFFSGAEPDSDDEAEEADPGLADTEESEEQKAANKVQNIVGPPPGPLLPHT